MSTFDDHFTSLFSLADQVVKYDGSGDLTIRTSNVDPIGTKVRKYKRAYEQTKTNPAHLAKFVDVYKACRRKYLDANDFDEFMLWFEKQSYKIAATDQVYFPLSIIFRKSCVVARNIDEKSAKDSSVDGHVGSTYPEQFMLHLFRIFLFTCSKEDKKKIEETVDTLETNLGLKEGENPDPVDGLSDVVSMATDVIGDMGLNIPKGSFNASDFKNVISNFTKDPNAKKQMKKMFSGIKIKDKDDIPGAFSQIFEKMKENAAEIPEPVQRSMAASSDDPNGELSLGLS